jgi:hypothetical protein
MSGASSAPPPADAAAGRPSACSISASPPRSPPRSSSASPARSFSDSGSPNGPAHGAPETIFYVHGVVFAAWFLLLLVQPSLVTAGRVDLHRRLGLLGAALAVAVAARAAAEEHRALRARGDPARGAAARRGAAGACRERQGRSRQIAAEARSAGHGYGAATASTPRTTSVKSGSPGPPGLSPSSKLIVQLGKVPVTCAAGAARAGSPASAVPWLNRSRT